MISMRIALATLHLLALGVGLGAVYVRAVSLRGPLDMAAIRRAFAADAGWGIAAAIWISTGVWRLLASTEKSTEYYMANRFFMWKMGLLALILILEIRPMVTLIKWRRAAAKDALEIQAITTDARRIATVSTIQSILVVLMVALAVSMARGI
jgi:putative membrane protein